LDLARDAAVSYLVSIVKRIVHKPGDERSLANCKREERNKLLQGGEGIIV